MQIHLEFIMLLFFQVSDDGSHIAQVGHTPPSPKPLVVKTALAQDASPLPNHSSYFHIVGHVTKVTVDFGLDNHDHPLTPANLSQHLGERQCV